MDSASAVAPQISSAIALIQDLLQDFAGLGDFQGRLTFVFGDQWDPQRASDLQAQWLSGSFELPPVEVRSQAELGGANGAYAAAVNRIYLSAEFLEANQGQPGAIANVLLEEYGHFVDAQINSVDTPGDEGAIFASVVQGIESTPQSLAGLKAEDDTTIISIDGQDITIEQADTPIVTFSVAPQIVSEDGETNLVYTFTRTGDITDSLGVEVLVSGTAIFGSDYTQNGATIDGDSSLIVTFAPGASEAIVTVDPIKDDVKEEDEIITVFLALGSNYIVGTPKAVIGTITDLPIITLSVAPPVVSEDGETNLVYTFTRTGDLTNSLSVDFLVGGTALFDPVNGDYSQTGAESFNATSGTVTFAEGAESVTMLINPINDSAFENEETVELILATNNSYSIGTLEAVIGKISDLPIITLSVAPPIVSEDGYRNLVYTFTRTGDLSNSLNVDFVVGGTANFNSDYSQSGAESFNVTSGTVTFKDGAATAIVKIDPIQDSSLEDDRETVELTLAKENSYSIGTPDAVTGTIDANFEDFFNVLSKELSIEPELLVNFFVDKLRNVEFSESNVNKLEVVFGENFSSQKVLEIYQQWTIKDFTAFPYLGISSSTELNGAIGAYAAENNTLYISKEYLSENIGNDEDIFAVILEGLGSFLDTQVNSDDAVGNEGALFAAVLLNDEELL